MNHEEMSAPAQAGARSSNSFPNYAGLDSVDADIAAELEAAGIKVERLPESCRSWHPEMRTIVVGVLGKWTFRRAWRYWACEGPGIEIAAAERLHATHGAVVRVDGHAGAPSPGEHFEGLACGHYHVDTQDGLNALAETIRSLMQANNAGTKGPAALGVPTYQHVCAMAKVREAARFLARADEQVIYRDAFRWKDDATGHVLSNHFESQSIESLAREHGYEIVHDFNHVAVVRQKQ